VPTVAFSPAFYQDVSADTSQARVGQTQKWERCQGTVLSMEFIMHGS